MLTILLHSSKTMVSSTPTRPSRQPTFLKEAEELHRYVHHLSVETLMKTMHISAELAAKVRLQQDEFSTADEVSVVEAFRGDIYSGLRAGEFSAEDKDFARKHLRILSGLYGILKPYDGIKPYRLEAGYRLPDQPYQSLYRFWANKLAQTLPSEGPILNVTSVEYEKLILPYVDETRVITPVFMTASPKTGQPIFVAVHAKIARGAFARWVILHRDVDLKKIKEFHDLGYRYDVDASTPSRPVFVCQQFGGLGLSQRLMA